MATHYYVGGAPAVKQVDTAQITGYDASTTYTITIGGIAVGVAGDADVNDTAAALQVALEASDHPYFSEVDWTVSTDTVTATAGTAGVPFTIASSVTGGSGTIGSVTSVTANSGPNVFSVAQNWDGAAVPSSSDTIIFAGNDINCVWDLDQSALTGMTIYRDHSYTGQIGLNRYEFATSADGESTDSSAPEYRDTALQIDWDDLEVGRITDGQSSGGSSRCNLENTNASGASSTIVHRTGSRSGAPAVQLKLAHASADVEIRGASGGVGIGTEEPGQTVTCGDIVVAGSSASQELSIGDGTTFTNLSVREGDVTVRAAANATLIEASGGTLTIEGAGWDTGRLNVSGRAKVYHDGQVDVTTEVQLSGGEIDATRSDQAKTYTLLTHSGGQLIKGDALTLTSYVVASEGTITFAD